MALVMAPRDTCGLEHVGSSSPDPFAQDSLCSLAPHSEWTLMVLIQGGKVFRINLHGIPMHIFP